PHRLTGTVVGSANHTERAVRLRRHALPKSGFPRLRPPARRRWLPCLLACAAIGGIAAPAAAQTLQAPNGQPVTLASPVAPVKGGTAVYLVQLKDAPAASYGGRKSGFAATKPAPG